MNLSEVLSGFMTYFVCSLFVRGGLKRGVKVREFFLCTFFCFVPYAQCSLPGSSGITIVFSSVSFTAGKERAWVPFNFVYKFLALVGRVSTWAVSPPSNLSIYIAFVCFVSKCF